MKPSNIWGISNEMAVPNLAFLVKRKTVVNVRAFAGRSIIGIDHCVWIMCGGTHIQDVEKIVGI